jgi:hypothetical protein
MREGRPGRTTSDEGRGPVMVVTILGPKGDLRSRLGARAWLGGSQGAGFSPPVLGTGGRPRDVACRDWAWAAETATAGSGPACLQPTRLLVRSV